MIALDTWQRHRTINTIISSHSRNQLEANSSTIRDNNRSNNGASIGYRPLHLSRRISDDVWTYWLLQDRLSLQQKSNLEKKVRMGQPSVLLLMD